MTIQLIQYQMLYRRLDICGGAGEGGGGGGKRRALRRGNPSHATTDVDFCSVIVKREAALGHVVFSAHDILS